MAGRSTLTEEQRRVVGTWVPEIQVVRDHSWGLIGTTVLELTSGAERYILKAGDAADHHLGREIDAHERWLDPWIRQGRAPRLVRADRRLKLLLTVFLPGTLVQGGPSETEPDTYRQAGALLAAFHAQHAVVDEEWEARERARTAEALLRPHRIPADLASRVREEVAAWPAPPATLVPTHGDWQPRNWLIHLGEVRVIDFGRFALRPAVTDLVRLATRQFRADPRLEEAFLLGYGSDPRETSAWFRSRVREAVGTAVWAYEVGDEPFEQEGIAALAELFA